MQKAGQEREAKDPQTINPWFAAGLRRDEVRNCGVLSWFLNPVANHGQGFRFLHCVAHTCKLTSNRPDAGCCLPLGWEAEQVVVRNERWLDTSSRADIQVVGQSFVVQIEAKIGASPDDEQLMRYHNLMRLHYPDPFKRIELFLSIHRNPTLKAAPKGLKFITWGDMADALRLFGGKGTDVQIALNPFVQDLGNQYADYIEEVILT